MDASAQRRARNGRGGHVIAARDIAASVPMGAGLEHVGSRVRGRSRADCPLCSGHSRGTVAYTERLAKCHRCGWGGDIFSLLMAVRGCDFRAALHEAADLASIPLDSHVDRRALERRRRERERAQAAAERLAAEERRLRLDHREVLREMDALGRRAALRNSNGEHDSLLAVLPDYIRGHAAAYALLAFGCLPARAKYVLHPECRRRAVDAVLAGRVRDADGLVLEVCT